MSITPLEVQANGGQDPGQIAVSEAVEDINLEFRRDGQEWMPFTGIMEGRLRTRGYSRSASARAEYRIEVLGVNDSSGRPVAAQVCSASGTTY